MWRNIAKQVLLRTQTRGIVGFPQELENSRFFRLPVFGSGCQEMGFRSLSGFSSCLDGSFARGYRSVAEEVSSTDMEEEPSLVNQVQEMNKEDKREKNRSWPKPHMWRKEMQESSGMGQRKYNTLWKRQVKIETEEWERAAAEYRELLTDMCEQKLAPSLPYVKSLFLGWFEPLRNAIANEQEVYRSGKSKVGLAYAYYIDQLPADKIAVITMHKVMAHMMTGGDSVKVVSVALSLAEAIEQEIKICTFRDKTRKKKGDASEVQNEIAMKVHGKLRKKVNELIKKQKLSTVKKILQSHDYTKPWRSDIKAKVGSRLIELLIQTAYIQTPANHQDDLPDVRPAFVHALRTVSKGHMTSARKCGIIECDPLVCKGLEKTGRYAVKPNMPMLVPPRKWLGYDKGAYLFLTSYVMRTHGTKQQRHAIKTAPKRQLQPVFEALDTLGNTKWKVNKQVLTVVDRIWNSGGCAAGLVDRSDVPLPEKPDTEDESILKKWRWDFRTAIKDNRERHSTCCDTELKLSVARKMKEEEGFYYPHNLDFRGRAYPMPPHLNHLGSDLCRGILEFAEGRPLGSSGLRWLKIHLANLYGKGVDKLSHEGRLAFTEDHLVDVSDSADRPLEGSKWWMQAEAPFQCLAVCIHLTEVLRDPSPETVLSHIPVHQDGTCNGLQHYAALTRDTLGAESVNLFAGEKPGDVYSEIATRVRDIMRRDADKDPDVFPDALRARNLVKEVDREFVKQTVMTSVYGVTYTGARGQIMNRLKERSSFGYDKEMSRGASYAAKVTLAAMDEMFVAPRAIMRWFGECAKIIASENETVRWTTPLGLPVVQPYVDMGKHHVQTSLQTLLLHRETNKVMVRKQQTSFPPNFVHSLDSSHMMMTAVACKRAGLCFAGVHDSFWTHACDVDILNKTLREKFVELYSQPILENLLESFQKPFPHLKFPPLPERGDLDVKVVLDSPYFFN